MSVSTPFFFIYPIAFLGVLTGIFLLRDNVVD